MKPYAFKNELLRSELELAKSKSKDDKDYWNNYILGLKRQYHGDTFGIPEQHESLLKSNDGYRNGFSFRTKTGRPEVGNSVLPVIKVKSDFRKRIKEASANYGSESEYIRVAIEEKLKRDGF